MPYPYSGTTQYNDCKTISITDLNKWGCLTEGSFKNEVITWSRNGVKTSSISMQVDYSYDSPVATLSYSNNGKEYKYQIRFTSVMSNLGKGRVLYFICPFTGLRCRKLYLVSKHFAHRTLYKGLYESQTWSRNTKVLIGLYDALERKSKAQALIHSKHFKSHYANTPTKRYLKALESIEKAPKVSMESLFMM